MSNALKSIDFALQLRSGKASKHLIDADEVKGGYFVVDSKEDLETNYTKYSVDAAGNITDGTIIAGSLCYCIADSTTYQYNGSVWEPYNLPLKKSNRELKYKIGSSLSASGTEKTSDFKQSIQTTEEPIKLEKTTTLNPYHYIQLRENGDFIGPIAGLGTEVTIAGAEATGIGAIALGGKSMTFGEHKVLGIPTAATLQLGSPTKAEGTLATAIGGSTLAYGDCSVALGINTAAYGLGSYAEGGNTISGGDVTAITVVDNSPVLTVNKPAITASAITDSDSALNKSTYTHAEGYETVAIARAAHAEGLGSIAYGRMTHTEGDHSFANGDASHAEGVRTVSYGYGTHAEGVTTLAYGDAAHAEGFSTVTWNSDGTINKNLSKGAIGNYSHTEGYNTTASGIAAHAEGYETTAKGIGSHASGTKTTAAGTNSAAFGNNTKANNVESFAQGHTTTANGNYSHAEGFATIAHADISHVEGQGTVVGDTSQVNVRNTGEGGHAEGFGTHVLGKYAHAEGFGTTATGDYSHSSGVGANALSGKPEMALKQFDEVYFIQANHSTNTFYSGGGSTLIMSGFSGGTQAYATFRDRVKTGDILRVTHLPSGLVEQYEVQDIVTNSIRVKDSSSSLKWRAEDAVIKVELKVNNFDVYSGTAYGIGSNVAGFHNYALQDYQSVVGKYNNNKQDTLFEVGNGSSNNNRHNAFEVFSNGCIKSGRSTASTDSELTLVTKNYVDSTMLQNLNIDFFNVLY